VKVTFSLAVGFSAKLLQITLGVSVGVGEEVVLTLVLDVGVEVEEGQVPQSAEQLAQFSSSDA
jgi:hypothetical protein